jgi:hypothetical protein
VGLAGAFAILLLVALPLPASAKRHHSRACHGHRLLVRVGRKGACVAVKAPAKSEKAAQHALDAALLSSKLRPRGAGVPARTLRAWLGRDSRAFAALEAAIGGKGAAASSSDLASASGAGWKTAVKEGTPKGGTGSVVEVTARQGKAKLTWKTRNVLKFPSCPDAAGELSGSRTKSSSLKLEVPLSGGRKLVVSSEQSAGVPFAATTDDNAALATLALGRMKMSASASGEVRDKAGHKIAVLPKRALSATANVPPLGPAASWPEVLTDPQASLVASSALAELVRGDGASLDPLLHGFLLSMQTDVWRSYEMLRSALIWQQINWWQGGKCVHVDLYAPHGDVVPAGNHEPLRATVVLTSAQPHPKNPGIAAFRLSASVGGGGSVSPGSATSAAGKAAQSDPVEFQFAAPVSPAKPTVTLTAVSKQGVATATLPLEVIGGADGYKYAVSMHASGEYEENASETSPDFVLTGRYQTWFESIDAQWPDVFVPARVPPLVGKQGASTYTLSAHARTDRSVAFNGESEEMVCTGGVRTPGDASQDGWLDPSAPNADGTVPMRVHVIPSLLPEPSPDCVHSGDEMEFHEEEAVPWGYGGEDVRNLEAGVATAQLTPAQLAAPSFSVTVTAPSFPAACQSAPESEGETTDSCEHSLSWSATLTFTKTATCSADASGGWLCRRE